MHDACRNVQTLPLLWFKGLFLIMKLLGWMIQDSAVCMAIGYGLDDGGVAVRVPVVSGIFSFLCHPDRYPGPIQPSNVDAGSFSGIRRPGSEADHSPPTNAEVKKRR
jgi:hypothetical protein